MKIASNYIFKKLENFRQRKRAILFWKDVANVHTRWSVWRYGESIQSLSLFNSKWFIKSGEGIYLFWYVWISLVFKLESFLFIFAHSPSKSADLRKQLLIDSCTIFKVTYWTVSSSILTILSNGEMNYTADGSSADISNFQEKNMCFISPLNCPFLGLYKLNINWNLT